MPRKVRMHFCSLNRDCQCAGRIDRVYLFVGPHHWWIDLLRWGDRGHWKRSGAR